MVVSDEYKYVFIQNKQTACTTIARELVENYGGQHAHSKHGSYKDFLSFATPEQKKYRVFIGIRNPLDKTLAQFFKYASDHQAYSDPANQEDNGGWSPASEIQAFKDVNEKQMTFTEYFYKYLNYTYINYYFLPIFKYDFVIRFENIQEDFETLVSMIDAELVRPLPVYNKTGVEKASFESYYDEEMKALAVNHFGPFMHEVGYSLPKSWGKVSMGAKIKYKLITYLAALTTKYEFLDHRKEPMRSIKLKLRGR